MFQDRKEIIDQIQNQILKCIGWGEKHLKVSLLILHVTYTFSKRRFSSFVTSGFLEHKMLLSLQVIEHLKMTNSLGEFEEAHQRTNSCEGIQSFIGDWQSHINALVAHEMAHVFATMAQYEPHSQSNINRFYNHKPKPGKHRHHNLLWRKIYRDLRNENKDGSQNTILIPNTNGFDFYFKSGGQS